MIEARRATALFALAALGWPRFSFAQNWPGYPTPEQVRDSLLSSQAAFPTLARAVNITQSLGTPKTHKGRDLWAICLSDNVTIEENEPRVLLVAAHHGDEITTVVTALHVVTLLLSGYGSDPAITELLNEREVWIAPVWNPDGYEIASRKNLNPVAGVDLNRNYPQGWDRCGGSSGPGSLVYSGPAPASEPETQTMIAWGADRRFAIVHDLHAGAFDVRRGFGCNVGHPFLAFLTDEAQASADATGLGMPVVNSCCLGGNIHHHMVEHLSLAMLWEIGPKGANVLPTQAQAASLFNGIRLSLSRPIAATFHVSSASTGEIVEASATITSALFLMGESGGANAQFGRCDIALPPGQHTILLEAAGHQPQEHVVHVTAGSSEEREVRLTPACAADCQTDGVLNIFDYICFSNAHSAGREYADCDQTGIFNVFDFICFSNTYANGCP